MNAIKNIKPNIFIEVLTKYESLSDIGKVDRSTLYWQSKNFNAPLSAVSEKVSSYVFLHAEMYFVDRVIDCNPFNKGKSDIDFVNGLLMVIQKRKMKEYAIRKLIMGRKI